MQKFNTAHYSSSIVERDRAILPTCRANGKYYCVLKVNLGAYACFELGTTYIDYSNP
jgi:hypothetical protein